MKIQILFANILLAKQKRFAKKNYMKTTINYLKNDAHCFSIVPFDNYIAITQQI